MASAATLALPTAIEDIDRAWLNRAIRTKVPEATVRGCEIVDVIDGTCTKVRIRRDLGAHFILVANEPIFRTRR